MEGAAGSDAITVAGPSDTGVSDPLPTLATNRVVSPSAAPAEGDPEAGGTTVRWLELLRARRSGRRDGRAGVPLPDQGTLPFALRDLVARGDGRVHRIVAAWRERARELDTRVGRAREERAAAAERLDDLADRRNRALAEHQRRSVEEDERLARLQDRLERFPTEQDLEAPDPSPDGDRPTVSTPLRLEPAHVGATSSGPAPVPLHPAVGPAPRALEGQVDDPPVAAPEPPTDPGHRGIGRAVYWPLIALIVAGEIPLNSFAFRLFGESDLLTYVMTATVAVALVAMAHFVGSLLSRERSATEGALLLAFVLIPLAAIAVIAAIRDAYLDRVDGGTGIAPLLGTLGFGLINVMIFGAAAALSFAHHDPRTLANRRARTRYADRERARAERARRRREEARRRELEEGRRRAVAEQEERERRAREALDAERRADLEHRARRVRAYREQVVEAMRPIREARAAREEALAELERRTQQAAADRAALEQRLGALEAERITLRARARARALAAKARRDAAVFAYCSANVRARADRTPPMCFADLPELRLPEELAPAGGSRG